MTRENIYNRKYNSRVFQTFKMAADATNDWCNGSFGSNEKAEGKRLGGNQKGLPFSETAFSGYAEIRDLMVLLRWSK